MENSLLEDMKGLINRYRWQFSRAFLMVLASNVLLILNPLLFRQAVMALDKTTGTPQGFFPSLLHALLGSFWTSLAAWAVMLMIVTIASAYFKYTMRIQFISVSREAERILRSRLFEKIQNQSMAFYDKHGIGELVSRLTNDISAYRDVLGPGVMYPLYFFTLVIPGMIALFNISPWLACISLIPLFAIPLLNTAVRGFIYKVSLAVQQSLANMSNMVQEHFSGIRIIKGYVIENAVYRLFAKLLKNLLGLNMTLVCIQGLMFPFFNLLTRMTTVILVLLAGFIIIKAWEDLNVADFISFMWIQAYIFMPVLMLGWVLPVYQKGRAAYDRLLEIYLEPCEVQDNPRSLLKVPPYADIEFNHLSFAYPGTDRKVLSDINLKIKGGSFVGITGPIGGGKTTLFRLLNREYEIPRGMLAIGGHDIHDYSLEALRKDMVIVEQIPFLFSKTIAENVSFGREDATQEEIEMVSQFADLHDTVQTFPEQYATMVGERGVTLSGGQKQRVAMARAFLVNRSILLLDDIFASVDTGTEKRIFEQMKKSYSGKTVILITHRATLLEQTERVIYIQDGHILEDGPPAELLKKKEHYAALVELQQLAT